MNIDSLPLLMGLLWLGFSLAFIPLLWVQRAFGAGYLGRSLVGLFGPASAKVRFVFTLLGLIGALGGASLVGYLRSHFSYTDIAFLIGMAIGVAMCVCVWKPGKK